MLSLMALVLVGLMTSATVKDASGYAIGDTATDFKLKNIDGRMVSMADYSSAKGFIVVFTCNHCPFAKLYEQRIIELNNMFEDKGYPVIAINPNDPDKVPEDSFEEMKSRAAEKGYTFPYLVDGTSDIARAYGATKTPHVYVLKKDGSSMKVAYIGAIDNNHKDAAAANKHYVQDAVNALLSGSAIGLKETRAIGCSIKWRS